MTATTSERILSTARKEGAEAEVFHVTSKQVPVEFEDNELNMIESSSAEGIALRMIKDGKMGFGATTRTGAEDTLVAQILSAIPFGTSAEFTFPGATDYPEIETFDPRVTALSPDALVDTGNKILEAIRTHEPDAQVNISVAKGEGHVLLHNTSGLSAAREHTVYSVFFHASYVDDGGGLLHIADYFGGTHFLDESDRVIRDARKHLALGKKKATIKSGRYPVIFTPRALSDLLRPLLACIDGDAVARKISPWRERHGEDVVDPRVSLYDDGLLPLGAGSLPWDDEGIPSQTTPLIEKGQLKNFLLDLKNSARLGLSPTGNGMRGGLSASPGISLSNLVMAPGETHLRDLFSAVSEGLVIHSLMGAWGANPYGGQVSGNVALGFKIENGESIGRVKDCMVYLNAFDAWQHQLQAISTETEQRHSHRLPYVLMEGVDVAT